MTKFEAKICVFLKVDFAFVGVVLHDTMKKTILGLSQEKRFMAGKSYRRGGKGHGKKNIRWNFIYMYWNFLMIASIKMIFVDDPKAKKLLSEAVYVTTDTVDPANDGKAVIVSAPFKLVEPAYDDEMGLNLDSIRISRKKERTEYERKQNDEDGRKEKLVWNQEGASEEYIGEALYKSVLTPELLTYIVDDIKIKSVENTEDTTTISVSAKLRRTILENDQHIVVKNEKENWTLSRALHPNRLKSKGQDIVIEKECPSCGANYVPDEKGCCSYCGYSLKVDNSKWKINASEKRNMSTIV